MMESAVSQQKNCRSSGLELGQHRTASFTRKPQPVLPWNQEGPHEKAKVSRSTVLLPGTRGICKSSYLLAATLDPASPQLLWVPSGCRYCVQKSLSKDLALISTDKASETLHGCWRQPAKACQQGVQGQSATVAGLLTPTVLETSFQWLQLKLRGESFYEAIERTQNKTGKTQPWASLLFSCHLPLSVTVIDYLQPVTWAGEEGCVVQQEGSGLFTVAWQKGRGVRVSPNIRELQEGISGLAPQGLWLGWKRPGDMGNLALACFLLCAAGLIQKPICFSSQLPWPSGGREFSVLGSSLRSIWKWDLNLGELKVINLKNSKAKPFSLCAPLQLHSLVS